MELNPSCSLMQLFKSLRRRKVFPHSTSLHWYISQMNVWLSNISVSFASNSHILHAIISEWILFTCIFIVCLLGPQKSHSSHLNCNFDMHVKSCVLSNHLNFWTLCQSWIVSFSLIKIRCLNFFLYNVFSRDSLTYNLILVTLYLLPNAC